MAKVVDLVDLVDLVDVPILRDVIDDVGCGGFANVAGLEALDFGRLERLPALEPRSRTAAELDLLLRTSSIISVLRGAARAVVASFAFRFFILAVGVGLVGS